MTKVKDKLVMTKVKGKLVMTKVKDKFHVRKCDDMGPLFMDIPIQESTLREENKKNPAP